MEDFLTQVWDVLSMVFGGIARSIERGITSLFGSSNARYIKKLQPQVDSINALESKYQAMTDAELREQTVKFRKRLAAGETWMTDAELREQTVKFRKRLAAAKPWRTCWSRRSPSAARPAAACWGCGTTTCR